MHEPLSLYTLRRNGGKLCPVPNMLGFTASLGGQKYHASPHKAIFNRRRCNDENEEEKKPIKVGTARKQEEVKGA